MIPGIIASSISLKEWVFLFSETSEPRTSEYDLMLNWSETEGGDIEYMSDELHRLYPPNNLPVGYIIVIHDETLEEYFFWQVT